MIQRIQTIWLLLAAIGAGFIFFLPYGIEYTSALNTENVKAVKMTAQNNSLVLTITVAIILESLLTIFSYKNRKIQKWLCLLVSLMCVVCIAFMLYKAGFEKENTSIYFGIIAPVLSLIFSLLAYRGIDKDDRLVKNLDRLR